jgi:glutamate formiminotransferase/formiminotetrahydrofolate cyclodeaminase
MTEKIVECIPNFSEARRPEVVDAILAAIQAVQEVFVLDRHSDLDHNRTVITFAGPPEAVEQAAYQAIRQAAELIDLNQHQGEHPRIGATDVVPFVPISGVSMADCVAIARRLGQRVGDTLQIPVYLYEEAATRPERTNLENIRRGEYETLKTEIGQVPERDPDFGPAQLGPAGATVIGAREPLIAFNVYLATDQVDVAKKIARTVRHSSGGLRYVKALGLRVEGRAQVSMNLTHYRKTPLAQVVELIRREAVRYGTAVHHSELVGLIPQDALVDAAVWYTQLDQFIPDQVLEQRLTAARREAAAATSLGVPTAFLDALASSEPTPGGGSAAAYTGSMAAALVGMVGRVTTGKKKYAEVEAQMQALILRADALRDVLTQAVMQDAAAFSAVMDAYRLPKDSPEQMAARALAVESAMEAAARVPLGVVRTLVELLELAEQAVQLGNLNALTDAASGAELAYAALRSASLNVRVNLGSLSSQALANQLWDELQPLEERAAIVLQRIRVTVSDRGGPGLAA